MIGLEQHLQDYPDSFYQSVLGSQNFLLDYVLSQGPTDVLSLLFRLAPESLLADIAKRDNMFESLMQGELKSIEAAQAIVSLLALQNQGFCPRLPEQLGPYPISAMQQRCDEVLQLALKVAIQTKQLVAIHTLISWSVDVQTPIAEHLPLYYAVATGNKNILERLLKAGAKLTDADKNGESALFWAIRLHQYQLAKDWLMAEQLTQRNHQGLTPTHLIAKHGWLEGLKALQQDQLMPTDNSGLTPLHYAAQQGHLAVFDYYQSQGIALDGPDIQGHTPLAVAIQHNQLHLVKHLMPKQSEAWVDSRGRSLLHLALAAMVAIQHNQPHLIKYLMPEHSVVNWVDSGGRSLLHLALAAKASECVTYLLSLDTAAAYCYHADHAGNTPLLLALKHDAAIEPFLDQTTVNVANHAGETPLLLAIRHQRRIDTLLQASAEVNAQAKNGDTPLILAVRQENFMVVEQLLAQGA